MAGLPAGLTEALADFGHSYGMAFQIVDDILDVISTDDALGKPAGHDLREGNYTLPVLLAVQSSGGERLRSILGPGLSPAEAESARRIIRSGTGVAEAYAAASVWADRAAAALVELPDTPRRRRPACRRGAPARPGGLAGRPRPGGSCGRLSRRLADPAPARLCRLIRPGRHSWRFECRWTRCAPG